MHRPTLAQGVYELPRWNRSENIQGNYVKGKQVSWRSYQKKHEQGL